MAFRTEKLRAIGGFDEALGVGTPAYGGEDIAILIEMLTAGDGSHMNLMPSFTTFIEQHWRSLSGNSRLWYRLHCYADGDYVARPMARRRGGGDTTSVAAITARSLLC